MIEEATIQTPTVEQQTPNPNGGGDPIPKKKKLFDYLNKTKVYTKSYEDFDKQFSTPESIGKLHDYLSKTEIYTKSRQDFENQYFKSSEPAKPSFNLQFTDLNKFPDQNDAVINYQNKVFDADRSLNKVVQEKGDDILSSHIAENTFNDNMLKKFGDQKYATVIPSVMPKEMRMAEINAIKNTIPQDDLNNLKLDNTGKVKDLVVNTAINRLRNEGKTEEANKLEGDLYVAKSFETANPENVKTILFNRDKIDKGEYGFKDGRLVKYESGTQAIKTGFNERTNSYDLGHKLLFGSDSDNIKLLNKELEKYSDPNKPIPVPAGITGNVAHFVGSEGISTLKSLPSLVPGAGTIIAGTLTAEEMGIRSYADKMKEVYGEQKRILREKHPEWSQEQIDTEAYHTANSSAKTSGAVDAILAGLLVKAGGKGLSKNELMWAKTAEDAAKSIPKESISLLKKVGRGIEGLGESTIKTGLPLAGAAGGAQVLKNLRDQGLGIDKKWDEGVAESMKGMLLLHTAFHTASKLAGFGLSEAKTLYQAFNKMTPEDVQQIGDNLVHDKILSRYEADQTIHDILQHQQRDLQIPASVKDEKTRLKINNKIDEYNKLKEQLPKDDGNTTVGLHESYGKVIKEKMDKIEDQVNILSQEPKEQIRLLELKGKELQRQLDEDKVARQEGGKPKLEDREPVKRELSETNKMLKEVQDKVNDPYYEANKIIQEDIYDDYAEWTQNDQWRKQAVEKPEAFLKMVAEQSQGEDLHVTNPDGSVKTISSKERAEELFGKELVKIANEKNPPKEKEPSKVSVIMPNEVPKNETITIEPKGTATEVGEPIPETTEESKTEGATPYILSKDKEAFKQRFLDDFNIVESSAFDWRMTSELSTKDRVKAVEDIKAGRSTAASRKLLSEIDKSFENGMITINRGRGKNAETVEIPIDEWFSLDTKEQNAIDKIDDFTASIINDNNVTLENIDSLKHLFDGFPYTEEDFQAVKKHLSEQSESNAKTKGIGESGKRQEPITEIPTTVPENTTTTGDGGTEGGATVLGDGEPPTETPLSDQKTGESDPEMTKMANAVNDAHIEGKFGTEALDKVIGKLQDTGLKELYENVKDRIKKGLIDVKKVRERLITTKEGSEQDQAALMYDLAELKGRETNLQKEIISESDPAKVADLQKQLLDVQNEMMDNALANRSIGRTASTIFRLRQLWVNREMDIVDMENQYMAANGLKELTPDQQKTVRDAFNAIREARQKLENTRIELVKALEDNQRLKDENEKLQQLHDEVKTKKKGENAKKAKENIEKSNERIQKAKDELRRLRGGLNDFTRVAPKTAFAISKIAAEKVYQGIVKFEELVKSIYLDVKDIFPEWTEKDVINHLLAKFDKEGNQIQSMTAENYLKSKELVNSSNENIRQKVKAYEKAQKEVAMKQFEWQKDRRMDMMANRPFKERMVDNILRWQRFAVLSYPSTLVKLAAVVGHQLTLKPLKFAIQKLVHAVTPKSITSKQTIWGNPEWRSLGKYYSTFIRNFALSNLKEHFSGIDTKELLYGRPMMYDEWNSAKGLLEMPGRSHGYIKSFIKNPEFQFAHEQQVTFHLSKMAEIEKQLQDKNLPAEKVAELKKEYDENDITNEDVMERINKLSLEHGKWSILMNDNKFVDKFRSWTGHSGITGALLKSEAPILKIPINYVGRAFATKYGLIQSLLGKGKAMPSVLELVLKGTKDLTEEQANLLGRTLTMGTMGVSFFTLGYFLRKQITQNDDGSVDLFGHHISKNLIHSPEIESILSGAETANGFEADGDKNLGTWIENMVKSDIDIAKKSPFTSMLQYGFIPNVAGALISKKDNNTKMTKVEDAVFRKVADMTEPGFLKQPAGWLDTKDAGIHPMGTPIKRKPDGSLLDRFWQTMELGIPGLRKNVPEASSGASSKPTHASRPHKQQKPHK